jgi:hypothetical protein
VTPQPAMTEAEVLAVLELAQSWLPCDGDSEDGDIFSEFEKARAAVAALYEAQAWRGIESAPRDGSKFLAYWAGLFSEPYVDLCRWDDNRYARKPNGYWSGQRSNMVSDYRACPPAGWLPLPPIPEADK